MNNTPQNMESLTFGRYLQSVRFARKVSLEHVARETRISMDTLLAIERDDHGNLPADVFVRGFLRAYAKVVGADGDLAVKLYQASRDEFQRTVRSEADLMRIGRKFWGRLILALAGLAALISLSIYLSDTASRVHPPQDTPQAGLEAASGPVPAPTPEPAENKPAPAPEPPETPEPDVTAKPPVADKAAEPPAAPVPNPEPVKAPPALEVPAAGDEAAAQVAESQPPPPPAPKYALSIRAHEKTWLKIIVDTQVSREYMLNPGEHLELAADKGYNMLIGNAGGVSLQLNGEPVPIMGKSGQTINVQLP